MHIAKGAAFSISKAEITAGEQWGYGGLNIDERAEEAKNESLSTARH
jgi:hypothetical protein